MASKAAHLLANYLHHLSAAAHMDNLPDQVLIERFASQRDDDAFAALVRRHGPMVLRVCQRVLHDAHAAEDAFQATFLVLSRKAASLRCADTVGCFLHGVAFRVAQNARLQRARRHKHESQNVVENRSGDPLAEVTVREAQAILDEELARLPEKFRVPLVLCCLEGRTRDEAARQLGWSAKLVKSRLEQGRERLRSRLCRRGLTLPATLGTTLLTEEAVSAALIRAAVQAAQTSNSVSASVALLAESAIGGATIGKGKVFVLGLLLLAAGVGTFALPQPAVKQAETPSAAREPESAKAEEQRSPRTDHYGDPLPKGAQARLGTIRFRHDHASLHLNPAFSRDGKVLVTGFNDIRLWDTATGKLLREIRGCPVGKTGPFFTPDGRWLIGLDLEASRKAGHNCSMIRLWDAATGQTLRVIPVDGRALACSPDGKQLATVAEDGVVSFWDIATGKRTTQLRGGHNKQVTDLAFTEGGKSLVTFCVDYRVCRWDLVNSRLLKTVELKLPWLHNIDTCLSPDGQTLAASPRRGQERVLLLDTTTGAERLKLQGKLAVGGDGLAFSPDGKILASQVRQAAWSGQAEVAFWDAGTGKLLRHFTMRARPGLHLCFAPDGRTLVTACQEPLIRLWDVATGKQVHNWSAHEGFISALAFTPDGNSLVSGSNDGTVRLWDAKTGRCLRELQGHRTGISGIAVTPDGRTIVSSGDDGCIRLQSPDGKEGRRILLGRPPEELGWPYDFAVHTLGLPPDGRTAVTYSVRVKPWEFFYHVWNLSTGKAVIERRDPTKVGSSRTFSPDARLVAQTVHGAADGPATGVPGGGASARPSGPTRVVVEDVATGKQVAALELLERAGGIVRFAADSRSLLTSSCQSERREDGWHYDNVLHLWELASRRVRQSITWSGRGRFIQAALSPDGRTVATAHDGQAIQLWAPATGKELLRRDGFSSPVYCLAFSPDGRSLASGHSDGTILVWEVAVADKARRDVSAKELETLWSDLAGDDAPKAYRSIGVLCAASRQSVPFLKAHLRPAPEVDAKRLARLIADLDDERFSVREQASTELAKYGPQVEAVLRMTLEGKSSLETRRRIQAILEKLNRPLSGEPLRQVRAVETLERIGTLPAQEALQTLAAEAPEARQTREAKAALERLTRRSSTAR